MLCFYTACLPQSAWKGDKSRSGARLCHAVLDTGLDELSAAEKAAKKGNESMSANQNQRNCREGSKPDRTSCAMDCGPPMHCCCSSVPWHRAKYGLDKGHWNQAPKPSSYGRCSMGSAAQHSTAQHSTAQHSTAQCSAAQHKSFHVKVSRIQMIVSCMCCNHHCSAAGNAVM